MAENGSTPDGDNSDNNGTSGSAGSSNGNGAKTVPESDLIAVKKAHGTELADLKSQLDTVTKEVASERTAKEAVETKLSGFSDLQETLTTITTERDAANSSLAESTAKVTEMVAKALNQRRDFLKTTHKLDDAKVKDLDESQLSALEAILPGVSKVAAPLPANLDLTPPGGSGDNAKLSSREKIHQGVASRT